MEQKPQVSEYIVTVADILSEYEVWDYADAEMLKDGRREEGKDKFISVKDLETLLVERINALKNCPLAQREYPTSDMEFNAMNRLDGEIGVLETFLSEIKGE
jgi:hypothetical protein